MDPLDLIELHAGLSLPAQFGFVMPIAAIVSKLETCWLNQSCTEGQEPATMQKAANTAQTLT